MSAAHHEGSDIAKDHNPLTRQVTVQLTSDQYERLFFQPTAAKGDLSKRLGNPTLLGLLGFLIPFSTTMFCLCGFKGASANSLAALCGIWYFYGGICMVLAGIAEFVLGNTFPFVVFTVYGVHWVNAAYTIDPLHPLTAAYAGTDPAAAALSRDYNSAQGLYYVVMALVSFVFAIGSLRTNVPFVIIFTALVVLFGLFAGGQFHIGYDPTAEGLAHAAYLFKVAGGFGIVILLMGWYLAIITACAATGIPCPLPVFDLSSKLFRGADQAKLQEHAGSVQQEVNKA